MTESAHRSASFVLNGGPTANDDVLAHKIPKAKMILILNMRENVMQKYPGLKQSWKHFNKILNKINVYSFI